METPASKEIYRLISLKVLGTATDHDMAALKKLLKENTEFQCLFDEMQKPSKMIQYDQDIITQAYLSHSIRKQLKEEQQEEAKQAELEMNNIFFDHSPVRTGSTRWIVAASLMCVLFLVVGYWFSHNNSENRTVSEISTKRGSKSKVTLPDGTLVWLNADSRINYVDNFKTHTREVNLFGEAFFDVKHDENRPFIVHTGNINIRVLGTAFNVCNYTTDKTIQTTLLRGQIELSLSSSPGKKIIMKPMDKATIIKPVATVNTDSEAPLQRTDIEPEKIVLTNVTSDPLGGEFAETSWINDKMIFVNQPLEQIASELERKYAVKFVFANAKAKKYHYTGKFGNVALPKILEIIRLSKPFEYRLSDSTVTIY